MIPLKLVGENAHTLTGKDCSDLHVLHVNGVTFSAWKPSPEERRMILDGEPVWVCIRGKLVPPLAVQVGARSEIVPPVREAPVEKALAGIRGGRSYDDRPMYDPKRIISPGLPPIHRGRPARIGEAALRIIAWSAFFLFGPALIYLIRRAFS